MYILCICIFCGTLILCIRISVTLCTYGTQLKQSTRVTCMSHACCFHDMGGYLATHACGNTCVHAQIVLHVHVPTCTRSVYMRVLFASVTYYKIAILFQCCKYLFGFSKGFHCRIGLQTKQPVQRSI